MTNLMERLLGMKKMISETKEKLNIPQKKIRINKIELLSSQPNFWDNPEVAGNMSQELDDLKDEAMIWDELEKENDDLIILAQESADDNDLEKDLEEKADELNKKLEKELLKDSLSGKYDSRKAIMTIIAGQGGHDAEDFVRMLFNMYAGYFEDKRWPYIVLDQHYSDEAGSSPLAKGERGLRNITIAIDKKFAFGYFKNEAGVHRLVRVSPFDAKKLRHTSFALIEMMPEIEEVEMKDIEIDEDDLKIDFFTSSGPGGQNANKRETAVRIVHIPTGLSVSCQVERSQLQNRKRAMQILKMRLFNHLKDKRRDEVKSIREKIVPTWGSQIRNYVFNPYKLVKDLRSGVETSQIDDVFDGEIDDFIKGGLRL